MLLSEIKINGFGYLDNVRLTRKGAMIFIHLQNYDNRREDVWLNCSASTPIIEYIKDELLDDLDKGAAIILEFQASYKEFYRVFPAQENSENNIVVFNAKLETIKAVHVDGVQKPMNIKQAVG